MFLELTHRNAFPRIFWRFLGNFQKLQFFSMICFYRCSSTLRKLSKDIFLYISICKSYFWFHFFDHQITFRMYFPEWFEDFWRHFENLNFSMNFWRFQAPFENYPNTFCCRFWHAEVIFGLIFFKIPTIFPLLNEKRQFSIPAFEKFFENHCPGPQINIQNIYFPEFFEIFLNFSQTHTIFSTVTKITF